MAFFPDFEDAYRLSMRDALHPLASFSRHEIELDDLRWPSVEHYVQGMQLADPAKRPDVAAAPHPEAAIALAKKLTRWRPRARQRDWKRLQLVYMTRGTYTKARAYQEVREALLDTGERTIVETSQYDYYWGCGRDTRGENRFGRMLMDVRARLREEGFQAPQA